MIERSGGIMAGTTEKAQGDGFPADVSRVFVKLIRRIANLSPGVYLLSLTIPDPDQPKERMKLSVLRLGKSEDVG